MSVSRPILRYHGGKWKLAPWIISHFPRHRIYVEPFGGAASVLLRKPRVCAEVYNDLFGDVVNVFQVLRDPMTADKLKQLVYQTPFARSEFDTSSHRSTDPVEQARRTIVRAFFGFASASSNPKYSTGFRRKSFRYGISPAWDWRNYPEVIPSFVERLRGVTIENAPAMDILKVHDREDVLFYVDPPYLLSTRNSSSNAYAHEMTEQDHELLGEALHRVKGMVVLSGYPSELYDRLYFGWHRVECKAYAGKASLRTEHLWLSPKAVGALNPTLGGVF